MAYMVKRTNHVSIYKFMYIEIHIRGIANAPPPSPQVEWSSNVLIK